MKKMLIENPQLDPKNITEDFFAGYLDTVGIPDPELIIRTGGQLRLSGFMPWQSVYSELYFTDILMPDFTAKDLDIALEDFASRQRRFGK
ncbi:MAG: Isoprenyl transferase [Candidatus Amesbacteria bacterium GW2011_GWA2_42_12]|uniref:Isoprenyl transferase n=1 Tax=Candidatus Amesbacteria bacterium GW2011_GWA2_42_12 TaxID=1618356 RepID=A0A0G0Y131_9BACT|nr:MAG: Isoprenyl transferase [Candidatus Amesbacteria bacterium GW2011_GWA2_42_12]